MKSLRHIQYGQIPRRYQLRWNSAKTAFQIDVHKECVLSAEVVNKNAPLVHSVKEKYQHLPLFDSFCGDIKKPNFGFNNSLVKTGETGDYVEFTLPFPVVRFRTMFACERCGEIGKDTQFGRDCSQCAGSGRTLYYDWDSTYMTAASLSLLCFLLELTADTSAKEHQLINLRMLVDSGPHGCSLDGSLGIDLNNHLLSLPRGQPQKDIVGPALVAMADSYKRFLRNTDHGEFRGCVDGGRIWLNCPGNACEIHSSQRRNYLWRFFLLNTLHLNLQHPINAENALRLASVTKSLNTEVALTHIFTLTDSLGLYDTTGFFIIIF